ncbi:MAG TPA: glycine betaine ABC transporter substrate-binding protein [Phycisphaerae bacterium]|nr:glycine betaine ABC transporter substrate-binding protein [Phycisphaerae bacterium]HRW52770.1 glycine betaine ABC transporter substrate-binding protein [Phycisphaerae bacterium]
MAKGLRTSIGVLICASVLVNATSCNSEPTGDAKRPLNVGSKRFTESAILGEMLRLLASEAGVEASHKRDFGSRVAFDSLALGELDAYVEYTGTLKQALLSGEAIVTNEELRAALDKRGISMSRPLGFNNTYILGMRRRRAEALGVTKISDLTGRPDLSMGFSSEFMNREDGWPSLQARYGLPQRDVRGMEHDLAYRGVADGALDVTDLYATDAKIEQFGLMRLEDDLRHFPEYQAVILYRSELNDSHPEVVANWKRLVGRIDETEMTRLNARADLQRVRDAVVAADFIRRSLNIRVIVDDDSMLSNIWGWTLEHLEMVAWSMAMAILVGVPLGVFAAKSHASVAQTLLGSVGIIQTIPALALLVFMLPIFRRVDQVPAIFALFLYSLLPIVRNTYAGLHNIRPELRESAEALGLPSATRMRVVELPLAARSILAGVKTATVINIGTATLGALIGAGGYGQPILTGVHLNNIPLILQGAVPAALLALVAQGLFEIAERLIVPRGLRLPARR